MFFRLKLSTLQNKSLEKMQTFKDSQLQKKVYNFLISVWAEGIKKGTKICDVCF
jgi:hypothetical protein